MNLLAALAITVVPGADVPQAFTNIDDAAKAALTMAYQRCDPNYECGGVISHLDIPGLGERYLVSHIVTSRRPFGVDLSTLYGYYTSDVVADFHTHICSVHNKDFANFFSAGDQITNTGLHTVGYMFSYCDHNIHRFDPSQDDRDDEEVDFHSGKVIYLTIGHIVGWVP